MFQPNLNDIEYIDVMSIGLALVFTGATLVVITGLDLITLEIGWTVLTYSFFIQFLDEIAEGPEALESALPGTIRLVALGLILTGFISSTNRLKSSLSEHAERLTVLNRVLRHNLRNGLTPIVHALTQARENATPQDKPTYESALKNAHNLSDLAEKTREVDSILERQADDEPVDLNKIVASLVDRFRDNYENVHFTAELSSEPAITSGLGIEPAIGYVIENACEHNDADDPEVTINVETELLNVVVSVYDNGSGIPEHELEPIRKGEETPLDHASGIGLWFIHWVVERNGGSLSFRQEDGQTVTLRFPRSVTGSIRGRVTGLFKL